MWYLEADENIQETNINAEYFIFQIRRRKSEKMESSAILTVQKINAMINMIFMPENMLKKDNQLISNMAALLQPEEHYFFQYKSKQCRNEKTSVT